MERNDKSRMTDGLDPDAVLPESILAELDESFSKKLIDDRKLNALLKKEFSKKNPPLSDEKVFQKKLLSSLRNVKQNSTSDPSSNPLRDTVIKIREGFIYSEKSYISWSSAAAALLALLFLPVVISDRLQQKESVSYASESLSVENDNEISGKKAAPKTSGEIHSSKTASRISEREEIPVPGIVKEESFSVASRAFPSEEISDGGFQKRDAGASLLSDNDAALLEMLRTVSDPADRIRILRQLEKMYTDMGLTDKKKNVSGEIEKVLKENPSLR